MIDDTAIEAELKNAGLELFGPILSDVAEPHHRFAFVSEQLKGKGGEKFTSRRRKIIRDRIREGGINLFFVIVNERELDVDQSVRRLVEDVYADGVSDVVVSHAAGQVTVWLISKRDLQDFELQGIAEHLRNYLSVLNLRLAKLEVIDSVAKPTSTTILRTIRKHAPVGQEELASALRAQSFELPGGRWLNHALDRLRKAGQVIRGQDGKYYVTYQTLLQLGTSKRRTSPDVQRLLALGRRR